MANDRNLLLSLIIGAKDRASGVLERLNSTAARVAAGVAAYFSARAIKDAFAGAISSAASLEEQLDTVAAVSGATAGEMAQLKAAADEMGSTTKYTATEAAQAMEALARAGQQPTDIIANLGPVLQLAQANALDLGQSAGIVSQALAGFGLEASDAGRVADVLTKGAASANTSVDGLAQALSYAAPTAHALGYSLEDVVAMAGKMADAGVDASRAGTALNSILSQIADPASKASKALAGMGLKTKDLTVILEKLERGGPQAEKAILAFGTEAGPALRALLGGGTAALEELRQKLADSAGSAEAAAKTMDDNLPGALRGLSSAWDALRKRLVEPLLEPIKAQVNALAETFREWTNSGELERMRQALVQTFEAGVKAVKEFLAQSNLKEWGAKATEAIQGLGERMQSFSQDAKTVANTVGVFFSVIKIAWKAVQQSVEVVVAVIARAVGGIVSFIASGMEKLAEMGVVSEQTAAQWRDAADTIIQASEDTATRSTKHFNELVDEWKKLGGQAEETGKKIDDLNNKPIKPTADISVIESTLSLLGKRVIAARKTLDDLVDTGADIKLIEGAMRELSAAAEELANKKAEIELKVKDEASPKLDDVKRKANELDGRKVIVRTVVDGVPTFTASMDAAKGATEQASDAGINFGATTDDNTKKTKASTDITKMNVEQYIAKRKADRAAAKAQRDQSKAAEENADANEQAGDAMAGAAAIAAQMAAHMNALREQMSGLSQGALAVFGSAVEKMGSSIGRMMGKASGAVRAAINDLRGASSETAQLGAQMEAVEQNIAGLEDRLRTGMTVWGNWFVQTQLVAERTKLAYLEQTQAAAGYIEQLERGENITEDLITRAQGAADGYKLLDSQTLSRLNSALDSAIARTERLEASAQSALESALQAAQDAGLGNTELERERLEYARLRADLEANLAEAQLAGQADLIAQIQRAMDLQEQAHQARLAQIAEEQAAERGGAANDAGPGNVRTLPTTRRPADDPPPGNVRTLPATREPATAPPAGGATAFGAQTETSRTVRLEWSDRIGQQQHSLYGEQSALDSLLAELEQRGMSSTIR